MLLMYILAKTIPCRYELVYLKSHMNSFGHTLAKQESGKVLYIALFIILQRYDKRFTFTVLRRYIVSKIKDGQ